MAMDNLKLVTDWQAMPVTDRVEAGVTLGVLDREAPEFNALTLAELSAKALYRIGKAGKADELRTLIDERAAAAVAPSGP